MLLGGEMILLRKYHILYHLLLNYSYNNVVSVYIPDFYMETRDGISVLEVKGRIVDRDYIKWQSVDRPLVVWKISDIEKLGMRVWYIGCASAFQAEEQGPSPCIRSILLLAGVAQ
jgi:hypothetical protein